MSSLLYTYHVSLIATCRMKPLKNDHKDLSKLQDYYAEHRVMPSMSAICSLVGIKSKSGAHALVTRLIGAGFLDYAPDRRLQPGKRFFERQIVGYVRAGNPQVEHELIENTISIDSYLIEKPSQTVLLTIKGDSMKDAGILDGDRVVVKTSVPALPGDIVVAIVDNEFTVKYLANDANGFYLKPANKDYLPIRAKEHLELYGLVVGSFRKL